MSAAEDGPAPDPASLDAVLTVLARHARDLAPLGAVRLGAGAVSLELGASAGAVDVPAALPAPVPATPHLTAVQAPEEPSSATPGPTVCSSTVGVFYRAAEPGAAPFVVEGDTVAVGQQVGLVEAMKLMIPLESDRAGRVEEFLVADGDAVEHGQAILRLAGDAVQRSSTHRSPS